MSTTMKLARSSSCPSKIANVMVKQTTALGSTKITPMKRCGNCGGLGHNRRTCGVPEHYAAICHPTLPPAPAHKTTQKKCGHCGVLGHNRRTCPQMNVGKPTAPTTKSYTTTQLFARLPNYIIPGKVKKAPPLEGLKGSKNLFREPTVSPFPPASERRAATSLAALLD